MKAANSGFRGRIGLAACAAAAMLTGCGGGAAGNVVQPSYAQKRPLQMGHSFGSTAQIWFHPMPPPSSWPGAPPGDLGSTDYSSLFDANAPWATVAAHTSAFGLYAGWVLEAPIQDLASTISFLNQHNMGIELEAPAMQATSRCGNGVEGYVSSQTTVKAITLAYLRRLQMFHANVTYVKVDEPFYFGAVTNDPRSCNFAVSDIAEQVSRYTKIVHTIYPDAQVGDVEPIIASAYSPNIRTALYRWHKAYEKAYRAPFPFFFADIDFSYREWPALVLALESATKDAGMRFGIIYIGDPPDISDAQWTGKVVDRFLTYQQGFGGKPDYVLFQSWERHPKYCLPESSPITFTGAIAAYIAATSP
jgi:hypothetical protein